MTTSLLSLMLLGLSFPAFADAPAENPALPDPSLLREYSRERLKRGPLHISSRTAVPITMGQTIAFMPVNHSVVAWGVYDGAGAPLSTPAFAGIVGHRAMVDRLGLEKKRAWRIAAGTTAGAGVLTLVGVGLLVFEPSYGAPVDRLDYEDFTQYEVERDRRDRLRLWGDVQMGVGASFVIVGPTVAALVLLGPSVVDRRQQYVYRYYTPADADAQIEEHNRELRERLGLTEQDVLSIDLQSRMFWARPVVGPAWAGVVGGF